MKWLKPSGVTFEANDNKATNDYLESLGYKKAPAKKVVKKAARKKK